MPQSAPPLASRRRSASRIPSLDGLRGVSILLVMLAHLNATPHFPSLHPWFFDHGALGVQVFFVISGFLITSLLLEEERGTGRISLKLFYIRRILRIFPAFYAFFFATVLACQLGILVLPKYNLLYAITYTMNYVGKGAWWTGHLWSLSVEEQFYLLWPALICLIGARSAVWAAASVAIGAPLAVSAMYFLHLPSAEQVALGFPFVMDSIAAGCVLASVLPLLKSRAWFLKATRSRLGLAVPLAIVLVDCLRPHSRFFWLLGEPVLNLGIVYCVARFTTYQSDWAGRFLNCRAMVFLGGLSYSLYLWQQPFLNRYIPALWTSFPLNCCFAFTLAIVSYFALERPFLRLRKRFQPSLSA